MTEHPDEPSHVHNDVQQSSEHEQLRELRREQQRSEHEQISEH